MKKKPILVLVSVLLISTGIFTSCDKENKTTQSDLVESNIKAVLDSVIYNTHVPGIVAGIWAPDLGIDMIYTSGVANLETNEPMSKDFIFRIGSNTKTMTITVLLQLVDEGLINLNDKLSYYLPDFPRGDEVTIEMMANMRSGIYNYSQSEAFCNELVENPTRLRTTDELIEIAAENPYYFDPGTDFHYSNSNTVIIGKIIEMVSGGSLESNINSRVIKPLNLVNTAFLIGGTELPGEHPSGYYNGEYTEYSPDYSEFFDISWANAAGAAYSDLSELKTYVHALTSGYFLSDTLQQHRLDCIDFGDPKGRRYGMGLMQYKDFYGHDGVLPGFTSLMINSPERNCTIVIWYNSQINISTPTDLLYIIPKIIYPDL